MVDTEKSAVELGQSGGGVNRPTPLIYHYRDELATRTWFPITNDAIVWLSPSRRTSTPVYRERTRTRHRRVALLSFPIKKIHSYWHAAQLKAPEERGHVDLRWWEAGTGSSVECDFELGRGYATGDEGRVGRPSCC